jgi:hypothetical protein
VTPEQTARYRTALAHVYWIGGPPDAGKTTVSQLVAEMLGGVAYRQDAEELRHLKWSDPASHPRGARLQALIETLTERELFETLWLGKSPETMARDARLSWEERIDFICDDLSDLPSDRPIVAEGPGFFPGVIVPLLADSTHAIWLVPTEAFKRASHGRREKSGWRAMTSDPERAMRNHIERDLIMAGMYRKDLEKRGLPWIEIDGSEAAEGIAERVVRHVRSGSE